MNFLCVKIFYIFCAIFVVFYTVNLYMCIFDLFHLLPLWHIYVSMECMYECMYVCSYKSSVLTVCTTSYIQQDRRCTYKVRLRRFRATIVAVEQNKSYIVWVCVSRLIYPPCNVHDPYCLLYPAIPYVANLSQKRHNFQKSLLNLKCCFVFLYNFCLKYFLF